MRKAELQKATGHIFYEAWMLYAAYTEYWEGGEPACTELPQWLHNCAVEATLMHAQALLEFFERTRKTTLGDRPPRKGQILAEDYGFAPQAFEIPSDLRSRMNTSIAPLSSSKTRKGTVQHRWEITVFIPPILHRSASFFRYLLSSGQPCSSFPGQPALEQFIADAERT